MESLANGNGGGAGSRLKRGMSLVTTQREAAEQEALDVLKEEVCGWLSQTLQQDITPQTFMESLDTGVELCKLVELIQTKAKSAVKVGEKLAFNISSDSIQFHKTAKKGTFYARDNTTHFIKMCKSLGISNEIIFESNGLVEHSDEKRVILCLLEVSRYAEKVHIKPPKIVEIEHKIDESERISPLTPVEAHSDSEDETKKELDHEVHTRVKKCKCSKKRLVVGRDDKRPMLGKYVISGGKIRDKKIIHVRRLRNTIMVRVGGGWETLDHFLLDYDPCRIESG